ncbi:MAG: CDP-alcohol phosphatidyltransferase family protein [Kofleriaceae bacterium]|nr:CDP-alcohol phosphatidyltransferase family protein [Kofleriaceae bacterium]MBP6838124.1 CDP-alcohol phosphatidyltransferase family protein [Kofleriaceae bacterium]MBP9207329.1 CDP-alcohol phosphatidyltransferase family protein [Kofleriaceae bacterium]
MSATNTPTSAAAPEQVRLIRYLAPNALTAISMTFGLISLVAAHRGNYALAGWMVIYAVLSDRLDGLLARALRATSSFGMQLDSFADFLNFGVAPAFLMYTYLTAQPDLPYQPDSTARILLMVACAVWVLGAVFRLARYNVTSDEDVPTTIFFGIPTTLAGGLLAIWFLFLHKYSVVGPTFGGHKFFGDWVTPRAMFTYLPVVMVVLAYLMVSSLPMPKSRIGSNRAFAAFVISGVAFGYVCGLLRIYPDLVVWLPTLWIVVFLVWGQVSSTGRGMVPPRLFPRSDEGKVLVRHQEDLGTDEEFPPKL